MNPQGPTGTESNTQPMTGQTSMGQKAQETTGQLADQAREKTADLAQQAQDTAKTTLHQQKNRVADSVDTMADALRKTGQNLNEQDQATFGRFAEQAADRLEQFSQDLQTKSVDEMFGDVQDFARRDPQLFLGGAVVLGLLAARFLKASGSRQQQYGQYGSSGYYQPRRSGGYYTRQDLADYRRQAMDEEYTGTHGGSYSRGAYPSGTGANTGTGFGSASGGQSGFGTSTSGESGRAADEDYQEFGTEGGYAAGSTGTENPSSKPGSQPHIPPYPGTGSRTNE